MEGCCFCGHSKSDHLSFNGATAFRSFGLSPRVRGNRYSSGCMAPAVGSIPACAGEPPLRPRPPRPPAVYPRVCGGTSVARLRARLRVGLSPRVRGNHSAPQIPGPPARSIPACAGEPTPFSTAASPPRVYPRVCGGTFWDAAADFLEQGLSPRVRGNRLCRDRGVRGVGSIPACAGEPRSRRSCRASGTVYPRVCGGTHVIKCRDCGRHGLSPRVRGNPDQGHGPPDGRRSIPACAGEPAFWRATGIAPAVYPRVCGGTGVLAHYLYPFQGLSPRVRGNLILQLSFLSPAGSIPACAGEPVVARDCRSPSWVYPRVCGGTQTRRWGCARLTGLSPRVRGNRGYQRVLGQRSRSIPACAGEPPSPWPTTDLSRVYPRVCGGTARAC